MTRLLQIAFLHIGQVLCSSNHVATHSQWNKCLQGSTSTSSPMRISVMQIAHSNLPLDRSIASVIRLRFSVFLARSETGDVAVDSYDASIRVAAIRWTASSEYTASLLSVSDVGGVRAVLCNPVANILSRCCGVPLLALPRPRVACRPLGAGK